MQKKRDYQNTWETLTYEAKSMEFNDKTVNHSNRTFISLLKDEVNKNKIILSYSSNKNLVLNVK